MALRLWALTATWLAVAAAGQAAWAQAPASAQAAEFEALFRARLDSARMRYTPADVHFMQSMIGHHEQALAMTALVPERTGTPAIRTLAARIASGQREEITRMRRWLEDRGEAVAGSRAHVAHGDHGAHGGDRMPGMRTEAQLRALASARGVAFDALFLRSMIEHHRGAVAMVEALFRRDGAGQDEEIFRFAADVQVDQTTEVARMERMLADLSSGAP